MKKILCSVFSYIFIMSNAIAQSVYMHEAQEDASHPENFSIGSILLIALVCFIIWIIYTAISQTKEHNENVRRENDFKVYIDKKKAIENGGFVCPVCGKIVTDDQYAAHYEMYHTKDEIIFGFVKYCNDCEKRNKEYENTLAKYSTKELKEIPDWFGCIVLSLLLIVNIATIVVDIIKHREFGFIICDMFAYSVSLMFIIGIPIAFYNLIRKSSDYTPKPPFEKPTFDHAKDCNAIIIKQRKQVPKKD